MPKGIVDPQRRERIARAAVDVVARVGVDGLTHRAVAAAAGVPVGSTTYHFSSRDDLLAAAVEDAKLRWDAFIASWEARLAVDADLTRALGDLLMDATSDSRDQAVVECELYVAALRRPALRSLSLAWDEALPQALARHTDAVTARALAMAFDGLVVNSLIRGTPLERAEVEPLLLRILERASPLA